MQSRSLHQENINVKSPGLVSAENVVATNAAALWRPSAAHPDAKLGANCSSEVALMNYGKSYLFGRSRAEFSFRALVDRTVRKQNREERTLAEQRATKHQFHARNSCILDGRNYRIARPLIVFAGARF